jgi:hypothetical protein
MAIDDLEKSESLRRLQEAEKSVQAIVASSQALGLVSCLLSSLLGPIGMMVATIVSESLNQFSVKRVYEHMRSVAEAMDERLKEVGETKVDKEWFQSEEFQSMLFETIRQATVTSDRKKMAMLGNVLANSGSTDFGTEHRKELFLRLIQDLSSQHIAMLKRLLPQPERVRELPERAWDWRPSIDAPQGDDLLVLQMLTANGLVTESLNAPQVRQPRFGGSVPSAGEVKHIMKKFTEDLQKPPERAFRLSTLGRDFVNFVSLSHIAD